MIDRHNRIINYLRVSLTDRCNLRCSYCMPEKGGEFLSADKVLDTPTVLKCVHIAARNGINKIRFTGGEPLLRKDLIEIVENTSHINEIDDISITTNGLLLSKYAKQLSEAGLNRVNISLDTLNESCFSKITRGGNIHSVLKGIEAAVKYELNPIKINCVVTDSKQEEDALEVEKFCIRNNLDVRFIRKMNLQNGTYYPVEGGDGGKCHSCNRIRLTADGYFKPCLFDSKKYSIYTYGIENAFLLSINKKPIEGTFDKVNEFYNVGG